jgi:hypothetical protein
MQLRDITGGIHFPSVFAKTTVAWLMISQFLLIENVMGQNIRVT